MRNTLDAVDFCRYTSGIVDLVPDHSELSGSVDGHLRSLALPNCNAQNVEFLAVIFVVDCFDIRHFPLARAAPRRPEVHKDIFPLADIVGELDSLVLRLRRDAPRHSCNCLNREILEHCTLGSIDTGLDGIFDALNVLIFLKSRCHRGYKLHNFFILKIITNLTKSNYCQEIVFVSFQDIFVEL